MKPLLIITSPYYQNIHEMLVEGAANAIEEAGASANLIAVPGAPEIPAAIAMAMRSRHYAGYVALGCVLRGETSHYDIVANESARGLQQLALEHAAAIGNGILTCETMEQAIERAAPAQGNKGGDAANAALRMIALAQQFGLEIV